MKTVFDLTREELDELRESYYYQLLNDDDDVLWAVNGANHEDIEGATCPSDIPDAVIYEHFEGISFVDDDFWCNQNKEDN